MSSDVHSCGLDGKESCGTRKWLPLGVGLGAFASENIWKYVQQNINGIQNFPDRGANPRGGHQSIIWQNNCQKLHENERNWTGGTSVNSISPPLDPPMKLEL